jgi:hypothetical protein
VGFACGNLESGFRQREHGDTARRAETNDDYIHKFEIDGHGLLQLKRF